jgi:hypothetical protein
VGLAAAAVCVELAVAAAGLRDVARAGKEGVQRRSNLVRSADLDPLAAYVSTGALALARETIPEDATWALVVGKNPPVIDPGAIRVAFRFWLQPRRFTRRLEDADWVIAYHASSEKLGVRYSREVGLGPAANALEVER